ncbi:LytTR family DNA-binding domain-containing protein [Mesorhizobium sp. J428]|uniref:LytTR family DNA-binding domain-containing protein n=1 Tax=Mesorhizobium sp. J428 TaxID=2898440 RepID=UPI002150E245|nr:LytTR family DNA-binding domain-containing protein [Mesorhizobium sp. J428]MCR5855617.1 LytTR family transcriptional regulator [Mesorhizobium sp. J428]
MSHGSGQPIPETVSEREIDRRVLHRFLAIAVAFMLAVAAVNASSFVTDAARFGLPVTPVEPWLLEYTSIAVILALMPLLALWERRFPVEPGNWRILVPAHVAGSLVYSGLHVAGMILLRKAVFAVLFERPIDFFDEPLTDLVYEYRKDALTYALALMILTILRAVEELRRDAATARAEARTTGRVTLKSGGRTIMLDAAAVEWARAAGNYVEVRAAGRTHLARSSLGALEEQLGEAGADMARVHRSLLVGRRFVAETAPAGDGDLRIILRDGTELRGSRRFRENLGT